MTSIPVAIYRFSDSNSKRLDLKKGMTFCQFLIVLLNCRWNLQSSENQKEYPSLMITDIIVSGRNVYLSV